MSTRGRPRSFDRNHALCRAQKVFWARGYPEVTVADLQRAMGDITASSFYAAFGSKEALFREIVELHRQTAGRAPVEALTGSATARAAIEAMLRTAAEIFSQPGEPSGCLLVVGAANCTRANRAIGEYLRDLRRERDAVIRERLQRGVREGDLSGNVDLDALTFFYVTILDGLALQARDDASRATLMAAIDGAMAAWDPLTHPLGSASGSRSGPT
jgi:AcrR family transcriptional regulator